MRIGIKILNFVLATILLTSAALHQEKADVFEFDLVLGVQTEEVGPGDYIECSPVVTNIGNIPGNVSEVQFLIFLALKHRIRYLEHLQFPVRKKLCARVKILQQMEAFYLIFVPSKIQSLILNTKETEPNWKIYWKR